MSDVTPFPNRRIRPLASIMQNVVSMAARAKSDRDALTRAHDAAEAFHGAISRAMRLEADIDCIKTDLRDNSFRSEFAGHDGELKELEERYQEALGQAGVALQNMPVKWASILSAELPPAA